MTTYHKVWWLVLLMSVAAKEDKSTWDRPTGCEDVKGLISETCKHEPWPITEQMPVYAPHAIPGGTQNERRPRKGQVPVNGPFPFPGGTQEERRPGLAQTSRIPSYLSRGPVIAQKPVNVPFPFPGETQQERRSRLAQTSRIPSYLSQGPVIAQKPVNVPFHFPGETQTERSPRIEQKVRIPFDLSRGPEISQKPVNVPFPFPGETQEEDLSNKHRPVSLIPTTISLPNLSNNTLRVLNHVDNSFNQFHKEDDPGKFNFSRNNIHHIEVNAFKFVDNLTILDLSYNYIEKLAPITFTNMSQLRELYFQHNSIRTLEQFTFQGLNSLEILDLSYCLITNISWWTFFFSNSPKLLRLQNNILTTFHSNYVYSPASLDFSEGINLLNNPIICDCELESFYRSAREKENVFGKYNLTCFGPESVRNFHMTDLFDEDFRSCRSQPLIKHHERIVEVFASNTTTLSCQTIPGPLFKNWTLASKVDGQGITMWPERFKLSRSPTWVNLTISDAQISDEGNYTCMVSERMSGSGGRRPSTATTMLLVRSPMIPEGGDGGGPSENDTTGIIQGDKPILWLVLIGVLILYVMVIIIMLRKRSRKGEETLPEAIYEPCDNTSHMYEDVDKELSRLAQRPLPRLPNSTAQSPPQPQPQPKPQPQQQPQSHYLPQPQAQPQSHYLQHRLKIMLDDTPESSIYNMSINDLSDDCSKGPHDNVENLRP